MGYGVLGSGFWILDFGGFGFGVFGFGVWSYGFWVWGFGSRGLRFEFVVLSVEF